MKHRSSTLAREIAIGLCLLMGAASASLAQGRGPGGGGAPPGGGPPGGGPAGGMGGGGINGSGPGFPTTSTPRPGVSEPGGNAPSQPAPRGPAADARPGVQLGPPGRWWDDCGFARSLKLRPDQQTRMDAIFESNRGALLSRFQNVMQAETQLESLSRSSSPDENALFAQIDRVAQARAELEKANTHYLLQLRKEMDADQIQRLEKSSQK